MQSKDPKIRESSKSIGLLRPPGCFIPNEVNLYLDWLSQFGSVQIIFFEDIWAAEKLDLLVIPDYGINWELIPLSSKTINESKINTLCSNFYSYISDIIETISIPKVYIGFSGIQQLIKANASFHYNKFSGKTRKFPVEFIVGEAVTRWTVIGNDYVSFKEFPTNWESNCIVDTPISNELKTLLELPLIWENGDNVVILHNPVLYNNRPGSFIFNKTGCMIGDYPSYTIMSKE